MKYQHGFLMLFVISIGLQALSFIEIKKHKPILFVIGDSTVRSGQGVGANGQWGWGSFIATHFDEREIEIRNKAMGGTSSRTFYNNPKLWQQVLDSIRPGDYVLIQFGHNDGSPIVDTLRARGTIKGNGEEYREVYNPLLRQHQMVYSYGFYLRRFVKNIHDKGAKAIICSPIPRNVWEGSHVRRSDYAKWAAEAATSSAFFVPLHDLVIAEYEKMGKAAVDENMFSDTDATHTLEQGARLNAYLVAEFIKKNRALSLRKYMKN